MGNHFLIKLVLLKLIVFIVTCLFLLTSCSNRPIVVIETNLGSIECELYPNKAPITASNFIRYVEEDRFKGATFYRTVTLDNQANNKVKIEVIQGGLYDDVHSQHLPAIQHESTDLSGILHKDGVLSMARLEPGTAMADFFICVGDQPELDYGGRRNPDGQGFAAFGKVISGMDVVHMIHQLDEKDQYIKEPLPIFSIKMK